LKLLYELAVIYTFCEEIYRSGYNDGGDSACYRRGGDFEDAVEDAQFWINFDK
jgi:hypothetical protein